MYVHIASLVNKIKRVCQEDPYIRSLVSSYPGLLEQSKWANCTDRYLADTNRLEYKTFHLKDLSIMHHIIQFLNSVKLNSHFVKQIPAYLHNVLLNFHIVSLFGDDNHHQKLSIKENNINIFLFL